MDKLVIASVLKPVNDSRNYEKTAISISRTGNYQVHMAGQRVRELPQGSNILFNPIFSFSRLSLKRLLTGWIFLRYLFRIQPRIVIVTTFELLIPAIVYRMFKSAGLIYDVQENYYRNLICTNAFPPVIRHILAIYVRTLEYLTRPLVSFYILAEKNYDKEFGFARGKNVVVENKFRRSYVKPRKQRQDGKIILLYSGTIAESYGIFEAISLAKALHQKDSRVELTIVGFAPDKRILEKVRELISGSDYIRLEGGDTIVPHSTIINHIHEADLGLISYRPNKSTESCIPTKLYEYLACRLPYLVSTNKIWSDMTIKYQAGFTVDFFHPDIDIILKKIKEKFYTTTPENDLYWEAEEIKLLKVIKSIK